jgi:hypothetical protein
MGKVQPEGVNMIDRIVCCVFVEVEPSCDPDGVIT